MDLLGSILGSMEKPPTVDEQQRKKKKAQKLQQEKLVAAQKKELSKYREKIQKEIEDFVKDSGQENRKFENIDKTQRAIVHEAAEVAGLTSFSFGQDEVDRYVMVWKKEFSPTDDELAARRRGEDWSPGKQADVIRQREREAEEEEELARKQRKPVIVPNSNYREKYEHLIGKTSAKDAAKLTLANKAYGFVPSENKRDQRTIEQVMADNKAKRQKTSHHTDTDITSQSSSQVTGPEMTSQSSDHVTEGAMTSRSADVEVARGSDVPGGEGEEEG